ncbi:MAG: alpha/beta hydrolase [Myxococcota bacterium]|nr:alpha/beta hydrolase [Myxococcota bacterium]
MALESKKRRLSLPERGVEIALTDWGGDGPLVLMHHANGFCAGTLGLVAEKLRDAYRVIGMDARGHGDSSKPEGPDAYSWDHFAEDVLAVATQLSDETGARVEVGIGHSFGGTSMLGAAAREPERFGRLVLVDPVTPPPPELASADPGRAERHRRLVEGARKRRAVWPTRAAAREHFASRPLFRDWLPAALDLYVEDGLRERADGQVELKCPGAVEAAVFSQSRGIDVFDLARRATVPTWWLWAARGDFPRPLHERVAAAMADAHFVDVDSGHLVPMEHPELVVRAVREGAARR